MFQVSTLIQPDIQRKRFYRKTMACHFRCLSKHGGVLGPRKQCQFCLWDTPLIGEFGFLVVVLVGGKHTAEIHAEIQQTKKNPQVLN